MKISDFKNEEALDILADIIEPAAEIFKDKDLVEMITSGSVKMELVKHIIKNHKKSIIEIMAVLEGIPVDEYQCNVFTLPIKLLEILNDEELVKFFTSQGQMKSSSGSAMETINKKVK